MGALIPLLLALLTLQFNHGQHPPQGATWVTMLVPVGVILLGWLILAEAMGRVLTRLGSRRWLIRWEIAAQGICLGSLVWMCHERGWVGWAPGWTAALAPWLVMQCLLWWTLAPALRRITGSPWSRGGLTLHHLRFEMAPVVVLLPALDICELIGRHIGTLAWFDGPTGTLLGIMGGLLLVVAFMALLPLLLVPLWRGRRLQPSPLLDILRRDCAAAGLGDVRLRVWDSPGGQVYNAIALGLVPGMRWVMLSEDLIRDLSPDQVRAVVGHELGHHRHQHLATYLFFALVSNFWVWAALGVLVGTHDAHGAELTPPFGFDGSEHIGLLFSLPGLDNLTPQQSSWVVWVVGLGLVLVAWRWLFGVLSRACERQADVHGAFIAGSGSMASALQAVARLSGTPENAPSWRHRPIAARCAYLATLVRDPTAVHHLNRSLRAMRLILFASLAFLIAVGVSFWFDPMREAASTDNPDGSLSTWVARDPALGEALRAADRGDTNPLIIWLTRTDTQTRARLATLHLRKIDIEDRKNGDGRTLWPLRYRLSALSAVTMDNPRFMLQIDNALAYGLVTGGPGSQAREITQAHDLIPRIEAALETKPESAHIYLDTIGCVRFASGEWDLARIAFSEALRLLDSDRNIDSGLRTVLGNLYRERLKAVQENQIASGRQATLRPLPLEAAPQ